MKKLIKSLSLALFASLMFVSCGDDTYTITVKSNNDAWGTALGSGTYDEGISVQIAGRPATGYEFVKWDDDNIDNPRTITVDGDKTYTAIFAEAGNTPGGGDNGGGDDGPELDPDAYFKVSIDGDTTVFQTYIVLRVAYSNQAGTETYYMLEVMTEAQDAGPVLAFFVKDGEGTWTHSDFDYNGCLYQSSNSDIANVNGQQYPHYLEVGDYEVNVTEYDEANGTYSLTVNSRLLDMQGVEQGAPESFINVKVDINKWPFQNYGGKALKGNIVVK